MNLLKNDSYSRSIELASKFHDIITDKLIRAPLYDRLKKDHKKPWTNSLTNLVKTNKERRKSSYTRGRGRSSPSSSRSSYGSSSSSTPIIQKGGISLYNLNSRAQGKASSSIHLEDILESDPLYAKLQEFLIQKQGDSFASIAKEEVDDIKTYEKRYLVNELYFLGESYKTQKYYEILLISTVVEFQHFSGYNTSENVYNFSKMIKKHDIHIEDWGISSMTERQFSLNKVKVNFTYWSYIQTFNKVICYNNERHKHTWFIKVCAKIFVNPTPNWFLNWWSYHGPTIKILSEPFLKYFFFIEFSVPWIHKWVSKVDFTEEQIPCLYRAYYNNFWDKLMKKVPQTKSIYGQELLDLIMKTIHDYKSIPNKGIITDDSTSVKYMARKISNHDEGEQNEMIMNHYAKSDSSMHSETSGDMHEAQPYEEDARKKVKDFLAKLKNKM
ncbi:hypothetical protein H5410_000884 [Solanum commersonii]|uniref:Uncharacterized protein n=1 Tax=Solanum commersonii TaxID=4109 RepID=A0A9J6AYI9_SOLCO|nr:hypothetical protein H5410_000884 [Solanum commersonii]